MTLSQKTPALPSDILVNRFQNLAPLDESERAVLRLIESRARHRHRAGAVLLAKGMLIRAPHFILSGWACRVRELANGRRQILDVLIPGDAIGLSKSAHPISAAKVVALSLVHTVEAVEIAVAWRERIRVPGLASAFDLAAAEETSFLMDHVVRLGRQTAYERMANWIMELHHRHTSRGLSIDNSIPMPMTQETMADALGLSVVHVNRTLQQMRRERRINLRGQRLTLLDQDALRQAGEFLTPALSAAPMSAAATT